MFLNLSDTLTVYRKYYENVSVYNFMTKVVKNEDAPFYFEKLFAGLCFLGLVEKNPSVFKIEIKPDRKDGANRRIEDLTRFLKDGSIEVIQIKHTLKTGTKWGFGDLWTTRPNAKNPKEGTNIFKFLKSWRTHKKSNKCIRLIVASNKTPTSNLDNFLKDIQKLKKRKLSWQNFQTKYSSEIQNIELNCKKEPLINKNELKSFISALQFQKLPDIDPLHEKLVEKLKEQGVFDDDRINAFIGRITKVFASNQIEILPERVFGLIDRLKTGLLQEIIAPPNYVERPDLESKIIKAVEAKKKDGGFVFLFAPSGSGKTVLLSMLADRNSDFLPYFCRIRPFEVSKGRIGYSNNNRLKSSWFKADIIQRCYEFGLIKMSVGIKDNEDFIDKTFDEALKRLSEKALQRPGKKIVIIVDALDQVETDRYKDRSVLDAIPLVNYPGVVFLLSTWGKEYLPQSIKNLSNKIKKQISIDLYFCEKEIKEYFKQAGITLSQDQIAVIKKGTGGLAISLFYFSKKLHSHDGVDSIIRSNLHYKEVFDWYKPIWESLNNQERECLGYLCFHFSPVPREDLRKIVSKFKIASFNHLIETIEHFLDGGGRKLEPYHDSFRRFVVSKLSKDKSAYHQRISKYYSQNTHLEYGRKYITKHLEAIGLSQLSVRNIFAKFHRDQFYKKILQSNLDNQTKVEIGKSFVNYFYKTNNIEQLVHYAITASDIYPTVHDEDIYTKTRIATEKLLKEVEEELLLPMGDQPWLTREWVFKRLAIGNILFENRDKKCINLAQRFIDDSLFRISLNRKLLWGEDENARHDIENNIEQFARALVNTNRYKNAIRFLKKEVGFKKHKAIFEGLRCRYLSDIHLQNFKINTKETLRNLKRSTKIERLLTYLLFENSGIKVSDKQDFKKLLVDDDLEKYLYNDRNVSQRLDLAEALFIYKIKNYKKRILNLLTKVDIEIPSHDHGYSYWGSNGNPRETFLRWVALKSLVDKGFNIEAFYSASLKTKFPQSNDSSEKENPEFVKVLSIEQDITKKRLLLRADKIDWKNFWKSFEIHLKLYKKKVDEIKSSANIYSSDIQKNLYPYSQDILDLIRDNFFIIDSLFPNKFLLALNKLENILGADYLNSRVDLLESLINLSSVRSSLLKDKIEGYLNKALEWRQKEELDNLNKSDNLKRLAVLAADKGFSEMAEEIFDKNLRYSRGLWNKGDLRISSLIDTLRTQDKEQFLPILKQIDRVSNVIEGAWYWKLDFLESATYADYHLALDYFFPFVVKSEVNQNEALRRIISTFVKRYPYREISEILPLLRLMDIKEENSSDYFEHISAVYLTVIKWSLSNEDYATAEKLASQYIDILKTDIEPSYRINLLRNFVAALATSALKDIVNKVNKYLKQLECEGYRAVEKSNSEFKVTYDGLNIKQLKNLARKGRINILQKRISEYAKTKGYFTDSLIVELVSSLSDVDLQKIRKWGLENKINISSPKLLSSIMKKAAEANNKRILTRTRSEVLEQIDASDREYNLTEIIKELDKIEFPLKRTLLRKALLLSIRRLTGSSYYLPQLFIYSSDSIDKYIPEIKKYSFEDWKRIVNKSTRLSLSK